MKSALLIIDDDEEIRTQMKWALGGEYEVALAEDRASGLEAFRLRKPTVVLLDLGLPPHPGGPTEGLAALEEILAEDNSAKVIIVSGQGERSNALQAVGAGAYDFLTKPVEIEELKIILRRTFYVAGLEREHRELKRHLQEDTFEGMLGASLQIQSVFNSIRKVAGSNAPVLILGESGTGKERVAVAIHRRSGRKAGPFIAINCSAIPETLLESELFGHEKGSFTGAHVQRKGRIEMAHGGTLFLDEIGEIPMALQVKLLRFLQEQRLERVGGRQPIEVDTRVIAATNVDLKKGMADGRFREDLFYRLAVVVISIPPLRQREGDVQVLSREFLRRFGAENGKEDLTFEPDAIRAMGRHAWPGNIRELENRVRRAVIMAESRRICAEDLELTSPSTAPLGATLKEAREAVEREMINQALRKHQGKIAPAASELGISRPTMYELMEKLSIHRAERETRSADVV